VQANLRRYSMPSAGIYDRVTGVLFRGRYTAIAREIATGDATRCDRSRCRLRARRDPRQARPDLPHPSAHRRRCRRSNDRSSSTEGRPGSRRVDVRRRRCHLAAVRGWVVRPCRELVRRASLARSPRRPARGDARPEAGRQGDHLGHRVADGDGRAPRRIRGPRGSQTRGLGSGLAHGRPDAAAVQPSDTTAVRLREALAPAVLHRVPSCLRFGSWRARASSRTE